MSSNLSNRVLGVSLLTFSSLMAPVASFAAPIHYYRFENEAAAEDSVGTLDLIGTPTTAPNTGFDDPVPLTGATNGQVVTAPAQTAATNGLVQNAQSITIEGYFNTSVSPAAGGQQTIVGQWGSGENQTIRLNLQAAGDGASGTGVDGQSYRLVTVLRQRDNTLFTASSDLSGANANDITLQANTNYYFAAIFDNTNDQFTYVVEDLDANQTRSFTQARGFGNWEETGAGTVSARFTVGSIEGGGQPFTGRIDEIRISNSALSVDQLLNVPEPGSVGLLLLGAGLILFRRRSAEDVAA